MENVGKIYGALNAAKRDVGAVGKNGQVTEYGRYDYRKFDDVLDAVSPVMAQHGILTVPEVQELTDRFDGKKHFVRVKVRFRFFADDGSSIEATTIGEAFDVGDKASTKAQTVALRIVWCTVLNIRYSDMTDPESGPQHQHQPENPQVLGRLVRRLGTVSKAEELRAGLRYAFDCVAGNGPAGEVMTTGQLQNARAAFVAAAERCRLSDAAILGMCEQIDEAIENPLAAREVDNYQSEPLTIEELDAGMAGAETRPQVDQAVFDSIQAVQAQWISGDQFVGLFEKHCGESAPASHELGKCVLRAIHAKSVDEITRLQQELQAATQRGDVGPHASVIVSQLLQKKSVRIRGGK